MASTNWDIDRKRRMPPAWDPPKLLLVVDSGLHVVVGSSSVVGVVEDGGVWLLGSSIWLRQPGRRDRGKEGESNREYSSKVLVSKELHYICMGIKWNKGIICGLNCRMPE